jgi:hypothetical protein
MPATAPQRALVRVLWQLRVKGEGCLYRRLQSVDVSDLPDRSGPDMRGAGLPLRSRTAVLFRLITLKDFRNAFERRFRGGLRYVGEMPKAGLAAWNRRRIRSLQLIELKCGHSICVPLAAETITLLRLLSHSYQHGINPDIASFRRL